MELHAGSKTKLNQFSSVQVPLFYDNYSTLEVKETLHKLAHVYIISQTF
jgi:hypothetical protein